MSHTNASPLFGDIVTGTAPRYTLIACFFEAVPTSEPRVTQNGFEGHL